MNKSTSVLNHSVYMLTLLFGPSSFLTSFVTYLRQLSLSKLGFLGLVSLFLLFNQYASAQSTDTQLSLDKFVDKTKAKIGNVMTYTLVLTNTGSTTAINVVVRDSMSTGLNFVSGSATVPAGTTLTQGTPISTWKVASLSANQSVSLTYQATADSSGILYNQAIIAGDTATVCTTIPVVFCAGDTYLIRLTAAPGRSSYKWFKDDVELTSQTTNTLDITAPGTYSLAVDNVTGKCPDFSCCPFIVEEDILPTFGAIAIPASCVGNVGQANGQLALSNFLTGYTYQYSLGTDFNPAASLSGAARIIPVGGVIANTLANPVAAQSYTVRVYNPSGCYTDVTAVLLPTTCCQVSVLATPGICVPLTNTYSTTALITLTNPITGTLTIADGPRSLTFATTAGSSTTFTASLDNLISDGAIHTLVINLPGCSTTSTTYTAPASCSVASVCSISATITAGLCASVTNTYSSTVAISLTNPTTGTVTITNGAQSQTLVTSPATTNLTALFSNLISDGATHLVMVSLPGCSTTSTTYTAPASCSVAPSGCSINAIATAGLCSTATNTYSVSVVVNLTNIQPGTLLVNAFGAASGSQIVSSGSSSLTFVFPGITSDGAFRTVMVSLPGCGTTAATFTAPASCIGTPTCSLSATATAGLCQTATNTYSSTVVINLINPTTGTLTVSNGGQSQTLLTSPTTTSLTATFANLLSDGAPHPVMVSLPGCSTTSTTYTAPVSCSVAPVCSISALATAGLCATATNTYSASVVVNLINSISGTVAVSLPGSIPNSQTVSSGTSSLTFVLAGLLSDGVSHTATVSLPGCGTTTAIFTAPASCSVAPVCSISAVATAGICSTATNSYSASVIITLTNPTTGTITVTNGSLNQTLLSSPATSSLTAFFSNLISDGANHTVVVSLLGCSTINATYTAPASCSVAPPVCSLTAITTAGICASATNTYSASVVINLTNTLAGALGITLPGTTPRSQTVSSGTSSLTIVIPNLISDGISHTITVSLPGCGSTTTTYTAPASCSVAPVCSISATVTAGLCASVTNTYSATALITLANAQAGTITLSIPGATPISQTITANTTSVTAILSDLISDGASHTVTISLPGCSTTTAAFTAPASCTYEVGLSITDPGVCQPGTNTYNTTGVISLTNAQAGLALISDGSSSLTIVVSKGDPSIPYSMSGLISGTGTHTVTVSYLGQTASTTYTAPASCTIAPVCSLSATATAGLCSTATNTYSSTVVINLTNPTTGTLTVSNVGQSQTLLTSPATTSLIVVFSNLISDGTSHTILVSLPGCSTTSTTYTAPVSCSVAPVCSISALATAGLCATATNTYSASVVVNLINSISGTVAVSLPGSIPNSQIVSSGTSSLTFVLAGLLSDGVSHTATVSLPGCGTTTAIFTAPLSCTYEVGLSIADPGVCQPGTNTYNTTGVISLTNAQAGPALISDGVNTLTLSVSAGATSIPYSMSGLISGTGTHTVTVSYLGQTASTTYTAPASCTIAPVCSLSAVATAGLCSTATNSYSSTVIITLTNPTTGTLTVSNGSQSQTLVTSPATINLTAVFTNLISDGTLHTMIVSLPGCSTTSTTYMAPSSCQIGLGLALTDPGVCLPGTNTYNTTGVISLTNAIAGLATLVDGTSSLTFTVGVGVISIPYSMSGLISGTGTHTVTVSYLGQTASTTYTAPAACSVACSLTAVATAVPVTCLGNSPQSNGKIVLSGFTAGDTYQYSGGVTFNPAASLSGAAQAIPVGGVIISNLINPVSAQSYTVRIYATPGCYKDVTVILSPTVCNCPANICVPLVVKQTKGVRRAGNP